MTESAPTLSSRVEGLSCPNCAGVLEVHTGLRVVECPYCQTPLLATTEVGTRWLVVEPQVDDRQAREVTRRWLERGWNKHSRLRQSARLGEAFLCFLPFFRVEADCVGFALGTEERRRTVGSGKSRRTQTYEVDVERSVERKFDRTYPAVNVAEWGVQKVSLEGDPLVPFEAATIERLGMVFPPTGSQRQLMATALEQFKTEADPGRGLKRLRFRFLQTLRERLSVVYYPLWVVRYRFMDRSYQVVVDAEDGTLSYGKAPGNDLYRALVMVGTQAATLFVATSVLQLVGGSVPSIVFVGLPLLGLLVWSWKRFRHGGVVIEGFGTEGGRGVLDAMEVPQDKRVQEEWIQSVMRGKMPEW